MNILKLNGTATIIRINRYFLNKALFAKIAVFKEDKVIDEFYSIEGKELTSKITRLVHEDPSLTFSIIDVEFDDGLHAA